MNVLLIGSGAREHCLAWKLKQSDLLEKLYCAPGNAGIAELAEIVDIGVEDISALAHWAEGHRIDLTVIGPEGPLVAGIKDAFSERGLRVFGPSKAAARLEGSKAWAKDFLLRHNIPTGRAETFDSYEQAHAYLLSQPLPVVVKADGLAGGKGVTVASTMDQALHALSEIMEAKLFGTAGDRVMIEECLDGPEVSALCITDGYTVLPLPPACDYKRVLDSDQGPNTGGMGAYSPTSFITASLWRDICKGILVPSVRAMASEGYPYQGVLYAGLMLTSEGPKVLEFNCRFGDPETQVILPRLQTDLLALATSVVDNKLANTGVKWSDDPCCGVVLASEGYPGEYPKGLQIEGLDLALQEALVFHAGTSRADGRIVTSGGRVVTVVGSGKTMAQARDRAYRAAGQIHFNGCHYRSDIGLREL